MRDIEIERWLDCRRELRLWGTGLDVNTCAVIREIKYRAITYPSCLDMNLTAVAERRDLCGFDMMAAS